MWGILGPGPTVGLPSFACTRMSPGVTEEFCKVVIRPHEELVQGCYWPSRVCIQRAS